MKKILFAVAVLFYCLLIGISGKSQVTNIPDAVQQAFKEHFKDAPYVRWVLIQNSYVATFSMDGQTWRDAYITDEGEFKGIGHYVTFDLLPFGVQEKINNKYTGYDIIELYQFDCTESGTSFFARMENQKNKLMLKLDTMGDVAYSEKKKIKTASKVNESLAKH